ncbi:MAG: hypothetical protein OEV40_03335 [Acidimicrobiia bacterium]|nr:hypothetical protein [Acidimicrobiia bacterium]
MMIVMVLNTDDELVEDVVSVVSVVVLVVVAVVSVVELLVEVVVLDEDGEVVVVVL